MSIDTAHKNRYGKQEMIELGKKVIELRECGIAWRFISKRLGKAPATLLHYTHVYRDSLAESGRDNYEDRTP